jgi:hypothetical protein
VDWSSSDDETDSKSTPIQRYWAADGSPEIKKCRANLPRSGIAQPMNSKNAKSFKFFVFGHDYESSIFMPYNISEALGVTKGSNLKFPA